MQVYRTIAETASGSIGHDIGIKSIRCVFCAMPGKGFSTTDSIVLMRFVLGQSASNGHRLYGIIDAVAIGQFGGLFDSVRAIVVIRNRYTCQIRSRYASIA